MDTGDRESVGTAVDQVAADGVEFHEPTGTYRTDFDPADRQASEAVIAAVSAATGADPLELPPIHDVVDPDALCTLFDVPLNGSSAFRGWVAFEYADALVTVDGRGTIVVEPFDGGRRPTG